MSRIPVLKSLKLSICVLLFCNGYAQRAFFHIDSLTTDSLKASFLEQVFLDDQLVRNEWQEVNVEDSAALSKALHAVRVTDSINLLKIEQYLHHFSYPNPKSLSELAALTPWLVIHHATYNDPRIKNYPHILNAYSNAFITEEQFRWYTSRALSIESNKKYDHFYVRNINALKRKMHRWYCRYITTNSTIQ